MSYEQDFFSERLLKDITVKIPLEIDSDGIGYNTIAEDEIKEAIELDLKSVILTEKGERFNKDFGVGISRVLFENFGSDAVNELKPEIDRQISKYLPWLSSFDSQVVFSPNSNGLFVKVKYKINQPSIVGFFELSLSLDRL